MAIEDQTLAAFLHELASSAPTPGGGAAAAVVAAIGAALVSMVANLSKEDDGGTVVRVRKEAEALRSAAIAAADEDTRAFGAVSDAYRMSKDDAAARTEAIQRALAEAVEPPLEVVRISNAIVAVADQLLPVANTNVISDIAVAARCAAAGIEGAAANVLVNLKLLKDEAVVESVRSRFDPSSGVAAAAKLAEDVEGRLRR